MFLPSRTREKLGGGVNLLRNVSISVIMLIALLLPSRSMAQQTLCNSCPPDNIGIWPGLPWINHGCVDFPITVQGVTCMWRVCYCYRTSGIVSPNEFTEVYICSAQTLVPCELELTPTDMITIGGRELLRQNPAGNLPCPPCPPAQTNYRVYWTSCKHETTGLFCNSLDALCGEEFKICCDPLTGARYTLFTGNVQIGGTCPTGCKQECP